MPKSALIDRADWRVCVCPVPPQILDPAVNYINRVVGGMNGTAVPHVFVSETLFFVVEHECGEVNCVNDGVRSIPVAFEAPLAPEEGGVPQTEGGGEGVLSAFAILSWSEKEEEIHDAKVINRPFGVVSSGVTMIDPEEEGKGGGNKAGWCRFLL